MPKLVRDRIPKIIESKGKSAHCRLCLPAEKTAWLEKKLLEEVDEYLKGPKLEELADILEVVHALAHQLGASIEQLEACRHQKAAERGAFKEGWILHESTE